MAAPFQQAFTAAIQRACKRFKNHDISKYMEICLYITKQQVCPRCALRLFGHPTLEDYCLDVPSHQDMVDWLTAQQPAGASEPPVAQAPAAQAPEEAPGLKRAEQDPPEGGSPPPAKRAHTDNAAGGQQAPQAEANKQPAATGTALPCQVCLGVLQLLDGSLGGQTEPAAQQQASDGAYLVPDGQPSRIAELIKSSGLTCTSFGLDISVPATTATRELSLYAHLLAQFGSNGVLTPWRPGDITELTSVVRCYLSKPLTRLLGKPCQDGQGCDVSACLQFDHPASQPELLLVAEDQLRMKQQRQQGGRHGQRGGRGGGRGVGRGPPVPDTQLAPGAQPSQLELQQVASSLNLDRTWQQLSNMPRHILQKQFPWPATTPTPAAQLSVRLARAPLMLAGRYLKLRRNMPQTMWCDPQTGQRIGGVSLAEHIEAQILPVYGATSTKFISGGREDADVRMMGEGRPFVMEVFRPQRGHPSAETLARVEQELVAAGHGAQVVGLRPCNKQAIEKIKEAEETKEKTYQALCWCSRALSDADIATLKAVQQKVICQDTPVRVLHRRAPKIREKTVSVEDVQVVPGKPHYFNLRLKTQAGTYIKEFCHGDWGRTCPSVADILGGEARVEIMQLDVLAVHMDDWP